MKVSIKLDAVKLDGYEVNGFAVEYAITADELIVICKNQPALFKALVAIINSFNK